MSLSALDGDMVTGGKGSDFEVFNNELLNYESYLRKEIDGEKRREVVHFTAPRLYAIFRTKS